MNSTNKRILLITRNLPPLVGGMENLLLHCARTLDANYSLTVIGPKGCSDFLEESVDVYEVSSGLAGFLLLAPVYALYVSIRKRFDLVFGGSGLAAPLCWLLGKVRGVPTLCYVHGLDVIVANSLYQSIFVPCLQRLNTIVVNSSNTRTLCIEAGIDAERIVIIHPGCDIPPTVDRKSARDSLQKLCGVESDFYLLFVGRIAPRKGLLAFMKNGFADLLQRRPGTVLVIAGDSPDESIAHRSDELVQVLSTIEENDWGDRVIFLGKVDNDTLSSCYSGSDCLLFPLVPVPGDVEGFGMVAIEAAAHGTQTVAFKEGGVADAVDHGVSGYLVPSGEYSAIVAQLAILIADDGSSERCRIHALQFCWERFDKKLLDTVVSNFAMRE